MWMGRKSLASKGPKPWFYGHCCIEKKTRHGRHDMETGGDAHVEQKML